MKKFIYLLCSVLALHVWGAGISPAYAEEPGAQILPQDEAYVGIDMRFLPAEDASAHPSWTTKTWRARPALFTVQTVDQDIYHAYCLEITVPSDRNAQNRMGSWDEFMGENAFKSDHDVQQKVAWIVHHSYPARELVDVAQQTGISQLSADQAISATQAAIWHLTDGVSPDFMDFAIHNRDEDTQAILALYHYLLSEKNTGLDEHVLGAEVSIDAPQEMSFAGGLLGPITFHSAVSTVKVDVPEGYSLVADSGEAIDPEHVAIERPLYVDLRDTDMAGEVTLTAYVESSAYHGSLVTPVISPSAHGQTLVLVQQLVQKSSQDVALRWRSAGDMCRDAQGNVVRDTQTGQIVGKESPLCIGEPSEAEPHQPLPADASDNSAEDIQVTAQHMPAVELAKTGAEIYLLGSVAGVLVAIGIGFAYWEKRRYRVLDMLVE